MNQAPKTAATEFIDEDSRSSFSNGASRSVNRSTSGAGAGNSPETIAERKDDDGLRVNQPIYGGIKRKFLDGAEAHPTIPKSSLTQVTREIESLPSGGQSGDPRLFANSQNNKV